MKERNYKNSNVEKRARIKIQYPMKILKQMDSALG
jgi:hypothetical protein